MQGLRCRRGTQRGLLQTYGAAAFSSADVRAMVRLMTVHLDILKQSCLPLPTLLFQVSGLVVFASSCLAQHEPSRKSAPVVVERHDVMFAPSPIVESQDEVFEWSNPVQSTCADTTASSPLNTGKTISEAAFRDETSLATPSTTSASAQNLPNATPGTPPESPGSDRSPGNVAAVASMRPRFRDCYAALLSRNRRAHGAVRLTLRIDCQGAVRSALAAAYGIDREAVSCLFRQVALSRFSPPDGGTATIQIPITFIHQDAPDSP